MKYLWMLVIATAALLNGCTGLPKNVQPVENFQLQHYLGTWYEIARLDHSFEKGMTDVSAVYTQRKGGGVNVVNRGYSPQEKRWKQVKGKAFFVHTPNIGYLKISFFGPFYGSYVIVEQEQYQYALVAGPNHNYLWLLSKTPTMPEAIQMKFITKAKSLGFDTDKLIIVSQRKNIEALKSADPTQNSMKK
ncbi:MAG: Outer membrane lipoprotein Blc [Candidatus Celerinatantimonas neptuna]|nr:MAG: Outer membrane lipoprotein Blc [Candidatus Celerinatantimonas neptuna]